METATLRNLGRHVLFQFGAASLALRKQVSPHFETDDEIEQSIESLNAEQERFQLWAANLGLQATGDRSLDYRIKDSSSVKSYASQLLEELTEDLSDLCKLLTEKPDPADIQQLQNDDEVSGSNRRGHAARKDSDDDASGDEQSDDEIAETQSITVESTAEAVRAVLEDITDITDRLYRLAAKLRSSTSRAPPSERNFYREPLTGPDGEEVYYLTNRERQIAKAQTEEFHLRRIEEIIRQSRRDEGGDPFPREDKTPELDPHTKAVIQRIARGNAYRQQQFMFWRQREWDRRNAVNHQVTTIRSLPTPIRPVQESQESPDVPATPEAGQTDLNILAKSRVTFSEVPSATWIMPKETNLALLDETRSLSLKTEITTTPTVYDPSGRKVGWPAFPKELGKEKDFICPYCFVTCPAKYRSKAHWRAHLIQDLQPYTCTAQACTEGDDKPLNTWEEWIVHEQVYHRMEYMCPYHPEQTFGTREMYSEHIAQRHSERQDTVLKQGEIDKNAQLAPRPQSGCPLCSYEAETWADIDKHLAFHLETLALLSLPLATGLERDDVRMESLQLEGGGDDAMQLLDGDAAGVLSSLFETEGEPVDEDGNQLPQGERITFAALEELDSKLLLDSGKVNADLEDRGGRTTPSRAAKEGHKTLHSQLDSSLVTCALSLQQFLPLDALEKTITMESVKVELPFRIRLFQPDLPAKVAQQAKKVFAILVLIGKSLAIKELLSEGITDEHLPLSRGSEASISNTLMSEDGKSFRTFATWKNDARVKDFLIKQWLVLAPVLDTTGRHLVLYEKCPLPFVEAEEIGGGPFGKVYSGELHPAHQRGFKAVDGKIRVAIKEFGFSNLHSFSQERQNLERIRSLHHPHLIQYHATCEIGNLDYIIFPRATGGNVRQFWKREDRRERTAQLALWSLRQMLGLAGALKDLHSINFRHGYLNPDNILHFNDASEEILVIAGVSVPSFHLYATHFLDVDTITSVASRTYEAPEVYGDRDAPRYDIWSLGCILLEFVIWFLYDFEAINVFRDARHTFDASNYFYTRTDGGNVEVHPKVIEAIEALRQDMRCIGFKALLNLIADNLLQVEVNGRDTIDVVVTKLEKILADAKESPSYLTNTGDAPPVKPLVFQRLRR